MITGVKLITNTKVAAPSLPASAPKLTPEQLEMLNMFATYEMTEEEKMEALDEDYTDATKKTIVDARRKKLTTTAPKKISRQ
jgi:hypothetical protein